MARGPVEGEAEVKHERALPAQVEQPEQRYKEGDGQQRLRAHQPDGGVLQTMHQIARWLEAPENPLANGARRKRKQHRAQRCQRPEEAEEDSIPADEFDHAVVIRVVEVEHLHVGAVVVVVALVRAAHEGERHRENQSGHQAEQIVAARAGLQIAVAGFVQKRIVGEQEIRERHAHPEHRPPTLDM